ncbi:MAG: hypothetical protein M3R17_07790 [Bacteroidota bacterium]|nr:hypothetical protein [Bacteroidota bacterium]
MEIAYAVAGDSEVESEFGALTIKINQLPADVIELYNKSGDKSDTRNIISEKLKGTGVKIEDLDQFNKDFKIQAVFKAFNMLAKNEELVNNEIKTLDDKENLDAIADIISSKKKEMKTASKDLSDGLDKFKTVMHVSKRQALHSYMDMRGVDYIGALEKFAQNRGLDLDAVTAMIWLYDYRNLDWTDYHFTLLQGVRGFISDYLFLYGSMMAYESQKPAAQCLFPPVDGFDVGLLNTFVYLDPNTQLPVYAPASQTRSDLENLMAYHFPELGSAQKKYDAAAEHYVKSATYIRKDKTEVTFNILKDLTFDYAYLSQLSKSEIKKQITEKLAEKKKNIDTVRGNLIDDQDYIWEMSAVLEYAKQNAGILPATNASKMVDQHVKDAASSKMWTSLGIGALSLLLGIAGFFTGGATTVLGITLLAGSAAAGVADLVIEYNRLQFGKAVSNTALTEADELGKVDVSYLGVVMALAGLGIDVFQVAGAFVKIFKGIKVVSLTVADAEHVFAELSTDGKTIVTTGGKIIKRNEFLKVFEDAARKYGPDMAASKSFQEFVNVHSIAPAARPGMFALMKADDKAFELLKGLRGFDNGALTNIGIQLAVEERLADSVAETIKYFDKFKSSTSTVKVLNAYAGANSKYLGNLPDLWKMFNEAGTTAYPGLIDNILMDARLQSKILNGPDMLAKFTKRWESWINPKASHSSDSFIDFVETGSKAIPLDKAPGKTIAEYFAGQADKLAVFATEGNFRLKNLTVLETSEPDLVKAINEGTFLPDNIELQNKLKKILDDDLIGATTDIAYSRSKVVAKINEAIGESVSITELRAIRAAKQPGQSASLGSVFESWIEKNYNSIGGKNKLLGKKTFNEVQGTADETKNIKFDNHYLPNEKTFVGVESKSGDGILQGDDLQQSMRYGDIAKNPAKYGYENVYVEYIFLSEDAARKSLIKLKDNIPFANLRVFFIDGSGIMKPL